MAHPGYPMQPMQPMPPMQQPGQRPAMRRGTSKAVPVVVSAGLAIGVFCGLAFGLGFEDESETSTTTASASSSGESKKSSEDDVPEPFQPKANDVKAPPPTEGTKPAEGSAGETPAKPAGSAAAVKPADGSSAQPADGGAAKPAEAPVKLVGKLTVVVKPEAAAKVAKVYIDGKSIDGVSYELDLTDLLDTAKGEARKNVTVKVKAAGYKEREQKVDLVASTKEDRANTLELELEKKPAGTGLPRPPNPGGSGGNKPKCKKPPCGLIDI